jgi:hypothetical protein
MRDHSNIQDRDLTDYSNANEPPSSHSEERPSFDENAVHGRLALLLPRENNSWPSPPNTTIAILLSQPRPAPDHAQYRF